MRFINFNQILCTSISEDGADISGIFDTLICDPGKNRFIVCMFYSQLISSDEIDEIEKKYYYRIILRYLSSIKSQRKHIRIDSGICWDQETMIEKGAIRTKKSHHETSISGSSGTIATHFSVDIDAPGDYEVDLYVKEMNDDDTYDELDKVSVKDLNLVNIAPFRVVFRTN